MYIEYELTFGFFMTRFSCFLILGLDSSDIIDITEHLVHGTECYSHTTT